MSFHDSSIFPSVIANTQYEFAKRLMTISFSHAVHIDVMDGYFVPSISFPHETFFSFSHLKHFKRVEVHLMVQKPRHWIDYLADVTHLFIIHAEIENLDEQIAYIKSRGIKVGLAFSPQTDVSLFHESIQKVDQVTIMTVTPGQYGAAFQQELLQKVTKLRHSFPEIDIECDGSMNEDTIQQAKSAGANLFVVGSCIQNAAVPQTKFQLLNELVKKE